MCMSDFHTAPISEKYNCCLSCNARNKRRRHSARGRQRSEPGISPRKSKKNPKAKSKKQKTKNRQSPKRENFRAQDWKTQGRPSHRVRRRSEERGTHRLKYQRKGRLTRNKEIMKTAEFHLAASISGSCVCAHCHTVTANREI